MGLFGGILGDALGGVVGLGAGIFGAINAGNQRKKMEQYLNQQDAENNAWYNENAYSDYTQRADSQNLIRQLRNTLDRQNQIASDTAVVTGSTPEQQAVQKEQSNKTIADVYGNIGSLGQQYKDMVTNRYMAMKTNLANQRMGMMEGSANSYEDLMNNGFGAVGDSFKNLGTYNNN